MTSQINYLIAQQRIAELHQAADRARLASPRPARRADRRRAAGLTLLAIGGTLTRRRARRETAQQPTIAA